MNVDLFDNWTSFVRSVREWSPKFECSQTEYDALEGASDSEVDEFWATRGLGEGAPVSHEEFGQGWVDSPKKGGLIIKHEEETWRPGDDPEERWVLSTFEFDS